MVDSKWGELVVDISERFCTGDKDQVLFCLELMGIDIHVWGCEIVKCFWIMCVISVLVGICILLFCSVGYLCWTICVLILCNSSPSSQLHILLQVHCLFLGSTLRLLFGSRSHIENSMEKVNNINNQVSYSRFKIFYSILIIVGSLFVMRVISSVEIMYMF